MLENINRRTNGWTNGWTKNSKIMQRSRGKLHFFGSEMLKNGGVGGGNCTFFAALFYLETV